MEAAGLLLVLPQNTALALKHSPAVPPHNQGCGLLVTCPVSSEHVFLPESHQLPPDPRKETPEEGFSAVSWALHLTI